MAFGRRGLSFSLWAMDCVRRLPGAGSLPNRAGCLCSPRAVRCSGCTPAAPYPPVRSASVDWSGPMGKEETAGRGSPLRNGIGVCTTQNQPLASRLGPFPIGFNVSPASCMSPSACWAGGSPCASRWTSRRTDRRGAGVRSVARSARAMTGLRRGRGASFRYSISRWTSATRRAG